jgi:hypothetical protein
MKNTAALALLTLALASVASAQSTNVYKWTDSSGVVHYTDQPPPHENASQLRLHAKTATPSSEAVAKPVAAAGSEKKLAAAEGAARTRNCENARANAATVSGSAMVVEGNDPTTARRMDQDELDSARKNAQRDIASWCDGGGK